MVGLMIHAPVDDEEAGKMFRRRYVADERTATGRMLKEGTGKIEMAKSDYPKDPGQLGKEAPVGRYKRKGVG
jgi:hypothetical protein